MSRLSTLPCLHLVVGSASSSTRSASRRERRGVVRSISFAGDDCDLVDGLRSANPAACAALVDRFSDHVLRVLSRILGRHPDLGDLHHDVFVRALGSAADVRDAAALKGWITIIAVNVARSAIKRRARSKWLWFLPAEEVPDAPADERDDDARETLKALYAVLDRLPADERVPFSLRIIEGMELTDVASATGVSLATVKRKISRAEQRFLALAERNLLLRSWVIEGERWGDGQ